jgi:chemotaxis protein CheX
MRMELIQPFINAADAVLSESLQARCAIGDVNMDEDAYRRKGVAAIIKIEGDIEGRVIFDIDPPTAANIASYFAGGAVESSDDIVRETVCELANQVIGNAVTTLNDQGMRFKISPPELHESEEGMKSSEDSEALVMCFETPNGSVYMNISMRYHRRRRMERAATVAS